MDDIKSRIIICGGRHFNDYDLLEKTMAGAMSELDLKFADIEVVS